MADSSSNWLLVKLLKTALAPSLAQFGSQRMMPSEPKRAVAVAGLQTFYSGSNAAHGSHGACVRTQTQRVQCLKPA